MRYRHSSGSVTLVALSCVVVLGIALASYLAVSNNSMKMSNRAYAQDVSRHLAEMGLERALRSFTYDTFDSWNLSGITATMSPPGIPSSNYGNTGITTAINLRVEHYRTTNKAVIWNYVTNYTQGDFVNYIGVWYLCTTTPPAKQRPSDTNYWTAAPEPWSPSATYQVGNIVLTGDRAYTCIAANANQAPPNATYWTSSTVAAWNSVTNYVAGNVVTSGGSAYRCISGNINQAPPNANYWLSAPLIYSEGIATLPDGTATAKTQLRAYITPAPLFPNAAGATALTTLMSSGTVDSYNSALGTPGQITAPFSAGNPNTGFSAVLAGGNTTSVAVNVTNATVKGYVAAPSAAATNAPWVSFGASSTPNLRNPDGSITSAHSGSPNVDATRISRSPFIPQFDIQSISSGTNLPATAAYGGSGTIIIDGAVSLGTAGGPTVIYNITGTRDNPSGFNYPGLDLYNAGQDLTINGPVILNVTGLFRILRGRITIASTGSLEIYFSGLLDIGTASAPAAPAGGISNNTNDPKRLLLVSTNSTNTVNNHYIRSLNSFTGLVYMPNAFLTITSNNIAINGALSARNIRFSSVANLHYDTTLRGAGQIGTFIDAPYMISEVRELTSPSERITLP